MAGKPLFRRVGDFSARHSRKIIVVWVAVFLLMIPFAFLFFSNVDFNIGGSLVPKNSMTQKSTDLQSANFGGSGAGGDSVVLVVNNTSLKTQTGTSGLLSLVNGINSTLSNVSSFTGITSIFSLERQILMSGANGISLLQNSTNEVLGALNPQLYSLINQTGGGVQFIYGSPLYYLGALNNTHSFSIAYNLTRTFLESAGPSPLSLPYLNSFTLYWNLSTGGVIPLDPLQVMNSSVAETFTNTTNPFYQILSFGNNTETYTFFGSISAVYSLQQYAAHTNSSGFFSDPSFVNGFSTGYLTSQISSNSTIELFLSSVYMAPAQLVSDAFNLTEYPTPGQMNSTVNRIAGNAFIRNIFGSPEIAVNNLTFTNFVRLIGASGNIKNTVSGLMSNENLTFYPLLPQPYVLHQFVGYGYSTTIILINFNSNISIQTYNEIVNKVDNHNGSLAGSSFYFSSNVAQNLQTSNQFNNGLIVALVIGIALSILIVGLFFRSPVAAFIPLIMFMFTAVTSMGVNGILYKYVFHASVSFITPTLLLILLLGLTSDYMVYIMARYRREVQKGRSDAAQIATQWSGNAVFTSGFTVALSYVVLWLSGIPIFSDSGLTNFIGVSITIVLANTLLIALLYRYGSKMFWPARISLRGAIPLENTMAKVAKFTVANKKKILAVFAVVSLISFYVYVNTPTGLQIFNLIPKSSAVEATEIVNSSFHGDFFERGFVILDFKAPLMNNTSGKISYNLQEMKQVTRAEYAIKNTTGVSQVYGPTFPYGQYQSADLSNISSSYKSTYQSQINTYIGNSTNYALISFQMSQLAWDQGSVNTVNSMNTELNSLSASGSYTYYTGGLTQGLIDTNNYAYATFLETLPILVIAIFAVLLIQLFSVFTPIRLISMVLLSVVMALAISYVLLNYLLSFPIIVFMPIFTVITLLAVGLDYDIFLITRVREEMLKGGSTQFAVRTTIKENGGVIIALGMLLFVTFIALHFTNIGIMDEIGTGLALGVLVDTFVSWPFFVPVIMLYMSKYNWWPSKVGKD